MDKRFRVLVVDDDVVNLQLINSALKDEYDILLAYNGHEAINMLKQYEPDLVLMDVMMPELNGFEACSIIKADKSFADIPLIFLTASLDTIEGQLHGLELGAIDYLAKPVNLTLLKSRIRNHLALKERNELVKEQRDLLVLQKEELAQLLAKQELQNSQLLETKAALRQSEELYRTLFEQSPDGIVLWSMSDRKAVQCNTAAQTLHGYSHEEFASLTVLDIDAAFDPAKMANTHNVLIRDGVATFDSVHRTKSGELRHMFVSLKTIELAGQLMVLDIHRDVTERKRLEEEKMQLEQQLLQTQKLESLGVLAGGVAHDFNNILAIIMGYCSLTKMDYGEAEKNIPEIERAVERAAALCRQMLAYAGKAPFEKARVDLCTIVTEMSRMLQSTIAQNVVIKPELSADVPCVIGDASQIRQVVMNLVINAAEAIGDAQGEVRVSLSKKILNIDGAEKDYLGKIIPHGCYACMEVADTGCGMSDETYNRIFEPFYTTKFTGRGLGMSAVLGIINTHNGVLQLSSGLGKGTTFKIFLPAQISDCNGIVPLQQSSSAPWQGSGTILLVEDEEQVKLVAKTMLKALGFTVIEASNGKEALELYLDNANDINLIITDMGMPVMDGYQLFSELKTLRPDLPIIISSGFGDTVVESRIAGEDIAGSIGKPYSFDRLRDVLKTVTEGIQKQT